jgi:hypothetical protein
MSGNENQPRSSTSKQRAQLRRWPSPGRAPTNGVLMGGRASEYSPCVAPLFIWLRALGESAADRARLPISALNLEIFR